MKDIFRNISSIFLALMVLLSTVSWTVDKHLCMGRVMDVSFFAHADDCGMEEAMAAMGTDAGENHCCDDETFTVKGQDDLKLSWYDLELEHQTFLVAFAHSYLDLFIPVEKLPVPHEKYPPPILVKDIQVLDQVFLI
ncbi:hypothetical protein [Flagellimonas sp. S3867]|uniref:HYC_CC_PP family protein n=1 Tax=Flagellimonas sp. S3867 TaxID=2768063 RepID=UPI0034CE70B2